MLCALVFGNLMLVFLDWSESKSDGEFGFSMFANAV
mgnify:CR=1 FL=1